MRTLELLVSALLISMLIAVAPVRSAEDKLIDNILMPKKDTCLLYARNCQDNTYVLQQRIERLQGEISKGTVVYSNDELNILRQRLDEANKALDFVFSDGA